MGQRQHNISGFGAPFAGLVFAHEVIVRHFSLKAVAPILISSIVAHTVSTEFYSNDPLLQSQVGGIGNFYEIPLLAVLGIIAALVATFYMRGLTGKLPILKKFLLICYPL